MNKQKNISENIQKSFALRSESEKLLQLAKQAVEVAIENGEEEGLRLLERL
jgi:hypothetical protein